MKKVLVIDDSRTARAALRFAIESEPKLGVVGEASKADEAYRLIDKHDPDIVTMDVYLAEENGLDITARIMRESPRPIIVVSAAVPNDPRIALEAMSRGALEVLPKLPGPNDPTYERQKQKLVRFLLTLSEIPVLNYSKRRKLTRVVPASTEVEHTPAMPSSPAPSKETRKTELIVIGASTGGPPLLCDLLSQLTRPIPVPVIIVQHIAQGFGRGFGKWLGTTAGHEVVTVDRQIRMCPDTVYIAPDNQHLELLSPSILAPRSPGGETTSIIPSIDVTFNSAAKYFGKRAAGILLTGMGRDGARGLLSMAETGAITVAQTPSTCVVDGMPSAAISIGAAGHVLDSDAIVRLIRHELKMGN